MHNKPSTHTISRPGFAVRSIEMKRVFSSSVCAFLFFFGVMGSFIISHADPGPAGVWIKSVLSSALTPGGNYGGVQTVLTDPVRPSDFYAFVSPGDNLTMDIQKSTDYGITWTNINATTAMTGDPFGAAIDPNPNRNPSTPPVLYTPAGFGSHGLWKSVDGGFTWVHLLTGSTPFDPYNPYNTVDAYSVSILPDNMPNHILVTYHYGFTSSGAPQTSPGGFGESTDGGATWVVHLPPSSIGNSHYMMIMDKNIWCSIAQQNGGVNGIWRTTTAGRVNGVIDTAAWTKVDPLEHMHGSFLSYTDPATGFVFAPGQGGIKRSTDQGATWSWVYQMGSYVSNVFSTDRYLYASLTGTGVLRADKTNPTQWTTDATAPSFGSSPSPYGTATAFDGTNWIICMGAKTYGLWRYVEPALVTKSNQAAFSIKGKPASHQAVVMISGLAREKKDETGLGKDFRLTLNGSKVKKMAR
jgi:hypothetical protein